MSTLIKKEKETTNNTKQRPGRAVMDGAQETG